jgi:hypothetical protein
MTSTKVSSIRGDEQLRAFLPGLELFALGRIRKLVVDFEAKGGAVLELWFVPADTYCAVLRCSGVAQLKMPDLGGGEMAFPELTVLDVSGDGLEGIRYRVTDSGLNGFSCLCSDVAWMRLTHSDGSGESVLWSASEEFPV